MCIRDSDKIKDLSNQIEAERNNGGRQVEECKRVQQSINRLQRQIEEEAVEFDSAAYSEKIVSSMYPSSINISMILIVPSVTVSGVYVK